jgi:hypothetical protein
MLNCNHKAWDPKTSATGAIVVRVTTMCCNTVYPTIEFISRFVQVKSCTSIRKVVSICRQVLNTESIFRNDGRLYSLCPRLKNIQEADTETNVDGQ